MTTATQHSSTSAGKGILLAAGLVCLVAGLLATVVGAVVSGSDAAFGALAGTLIVLVVFGGGAVLVDAVAGLMPTASLMIALLTYTLQVVVMALIFLALQRSGLLGDALDRGWLAGAVIAGTAAWLVAQIIASTRLRIPAYELTDAGAR